VSLNFEVEEVLGTLKDFQRSTARWVFQRMFDEEDPALRFLVADEVGLGKTHVAKGVVAQVLAHLDSIGDARHDIVYICSNASIAKQNLKKLVPKGVSVVDTADRLSMLPLSAASNEDEEMGGVNIYPITPGTSFDFGRRTGKFRERVLVFAFLRELWGATEMATGRARWIYWEGVSPEDGDERLLSRAGTYRPAAVRFAPEFAAEMANLDDSRRKKDEPTMLEMHRELVEQLKYKRQMSRDLKDKKAELIGLVRQALATLGVTLLQPDLVIMDEFQRFKQLLDPSSTALQAVLARRLFDHKDPVTGRPTRTLLLSATPYRMYSRRGEDEDHFSDFIATCRFLIGSDETIKALKHDFASLRLALTSPSARGDALRYCENIGSTLRKVIARTERLGVTSDRDGMLKEHVHDTSIESIDLEAYLRLGDISAAVRANEPTEYWKSSPFLFNFMDKYKMKQDFEELIEEGGLPVGETLEPGAGFISWGDVSRYREVDPQNGRLRWLLKDLRQHRAFELAWMPPSMRYYNAATVYETEEAESFTKRLIFSGWSVVPKTVSSLVTFASEQSVFEGVRKQRYDAEASARGRGRLDYRVPRGERPASMNVFAMCWPSVTLAELGDPRPSGTERLSIEELRIRTRLKVAATMMDITREAPTLGQVDSRWYWAAPLLMDAAMHPSVMGDWFGVHGSEDSWAEGKLEEEENSQGESTRRTGRAFKAHANEAWSLIHGDLRELGRVPSDLIDVLVDIAIGGPAVCALRALSSVSGLERDDPAVLRGAAAVAGSMRRFFNEAEVNALVLGAARQRREEDAADDRERYWLDAVRHGVDGNLQAVLDEHFHVLRDWLGFVSYESEQDRLDVIARIVERLQDALGVRAAVFRVDIPTTRNGSTELDSHSMRAKFAAALGQRAAEDEGSDRTDAISAGFNSPFWPFVLVSTSIGQEGLDFHLWSHAVVHWNLPSNPVDLEQREGRVHRFKGHAVRKNLAESLDAKWDSSSNGDIWQSIFDWAAESRAPGDSELVPYWVYDKGAARIERHIPLPPFSRDKAALPRLKKSLAAYRLAFGQPRQEELLDYLRDHHDAEEIDALAAELRIDLSPPQ